MRLPLLIGFVLLIASSAVGQLERPLAAAIANQDYEQELKPSGGIAPYKAKITTGNLPDGISLVTEQSGRIVIKGKTPTSRPGPFRFTVTFTDSSQPPFSQEIRYALPVTVDPLQVGGVTAKSQEDDDDLCNQEDSNETDCRGDFEAGAYGGIGIDNFAADELKRYLNPQDSGEILTRGVFGFNFGYRLMGGDKHEKPQNERATARRNNLWIYGETIHGVRSADVDCEKNSFLPVCQTSLVPGGNIPQEALFMLRNATSLEAFMGLRYEFLGINQQGRNPASMYFKMQAGFLTIAESGQDVVDMHHLAIGLTTTKGSLAESYLEVGWGRTDLFAENRRKRFKIDGYLQKEIGLGFSFFTQLFVDTDLGHGSDSVQTYIGFNYNLEKVIGTFK